MGLIKCFHKYFLISSSWIQPGINLEFLLVLLRGEQVNGWEWQSVKERAWAHNLIINDLWFCFSWPHPRNGKDLKKSPGLASCLFPEAGCLNYDGLMSVNHQISFPVTAFCSNHGAKIYPTKISLGLIKTHSFPMFPKIYSSKSPWEPSLVIHASSQGSARPPGQSPLSFMALWQLPLPGSRPSPADSYPLLKHCHQIWSVHDQITSITSKILINMGQHLNSIFQSGIQLLPLSAQGQPQWRGLDICAWSVSPVTGLYR